MSDDEYTRKDGRITLPVRSVRPTWPRGARWTSAVALPHRPSGKYGATYDWWEAEAATEKEARDGLTALVLAGLHAARQPVVLVIGGAEPDYHTAIHVVRMTASGGHVDVIRQRADGKPRQAASWGSNNATLDEEVAAVLAHVGGEPTIIRLT